MISLSKHHGLGNDFLVADASQFAPGTDVAALAQRWCDRRRGIGADGLVLLTILGIGFWSAVYAALVVGRLQHSFMNQRLFLLGLATVWLGRPADLAQQLVLAAASVSVLGTEHDVPVIAAWSVGAAG